ncbi:MAG: glycoside hydrolase family 44 protein [Oscillospiraceae bacterium]|nr:glycoside hydrolase family 44 protein [Oscillospiraceae bacterium]
MKNNKSKYFFRRTVSFAAAAAIIACLANSGTEVSATFSSSYLDSGSVTVNIDTSAGRKNISPYIYGINSESDLSGVSVNAVIQTHPDVSSYNWESNLSNDGSGNSNVLVSTYPESKLSEPGLYTDYLVKRAGRYNIPSRYVTLQMMDKVAGHSFSDKLWNDVEFSKNDSYLSKPNTEDDIVYMDEYVSFLVNKYDYAMNGGINGYFLGNEPENWSVRYPEAVPQPVTADELIKRSSELAYSVKMIDPTALVYGPSLNGIEAFININNPEDWEQHGIEYSWFIDYYLDGMRLASEDKGTRLLDVLDIHYHTEATNGLFQPIIDSDDVFSNNTRLQAPRILWDSSYTENSTSAILHNQHIPLIPTLAASIDMYYPGTRLSFSEYNFGGGNDISGGIATADALGIFAEYGVHMACVKPNTEDISYIKSALNIYTNYDGDGSGFGDTLVSSSNGKDIMSSVYASVESGDESKLKVILINKNNTAAKSAEINIQSIYDFESADVYSFNAESPDIVKAEESVDISEDSFSFEMEPLTVYMLVFNADGDILTVDPVDLPPDTEISENTQTDISGEISTTGTVSETSTVTTTTFVPEHVEAATYSAASVNESRPSETVESVSTTVPEETEPDDTEETVTAASGTDTEKTVPKAVKVIVSILVGAVVLSMAYILVNDYIMSKRK